MREPSDLAGKRIGLADFQQTATVWMRGMLQHEYGVDLEKIDWFTWEEGGRVKMDVPKRYSVQQLPLGKKPDEMLHRGDLDAIMHATLFPRSCAQVMPGVFLKTISRWKL